MAVFIRLTRSGVRRILIMAFVFLSGLTIGTFFATYSSKVLDLYAFDDTAMPSQLPIASFSLANKLNNDVRILCWIMTNPANHESKARHLRDTWGRRCNILLFMTTSDDPSLGNTVNLPVEEGYINLWNKTKEAFKHVYEKYYDAADWFMKADDDTYVFVDNLRYFLYAYSSSDPIYFGYKFRVPWVRDAYMSGGAGYVLSKEALRRFVEEALPDGNKCKPDATGAEDLELGKCLENVQVLAGDSRDLEKGRFFPFRMDNHLWPGDDIPDWYFANSYYPVLDGLDGCSETAISFHYIDASMMYVIDYLVYQLQPIGMEQKTITLPPKRYFGDIIADLQPYSDWSRPITMATTTPEVE